MKIFFMGGKQAGCIGLLTMLAKGNSVKGAVMYDEMTSKLATELKIPVFSSIKSPECHGLVKDSDLLVSVHGREIVPGSVLAMPRLGCINAHPCLYKYKGARPVERMLEDGETRASVGIHRMTEKLDEGEVLSEIFIDVSGKKTTEEVYNLLYPLYSLSIIKALEKLK